MYEGESIYNYLQVKETDDSVVLSTNVLFGVQSIMMKDDSLTGMYYDYALAAPVMTQVSEREDASILVLGMGTGTFAGQCRQYFGDVSIEGVEIDRKITDLATAHFALPEDIEVTTYDGRAYLNAIDDKYDVIMVDAYQDITIPFQMSSVEFFTMVKEHLKEDGVMVVNMNMHTDKEGNINQYLADTIATVFDSVYTVDVVGSTNRELFAAMEPGIIESLSEKADALADEELKSMMQWAAKTMVKYEKGDYLLTDDRAAVELLGMQVIDDLINREIGYYKEIFEKEGIKGLLQNL